MSSYEVYSVPPTNKASILTDLDDLHNLTCKFFRKKYCAEKQLNGENFLPSNVALNKNQMNCLPTVYQQLYTVSVMASTTRVCEATEYKPHIHPLPM